MIVGVAEAVKEQLYQDKISGYPALLRQFTDSTISNNDKPAFWKSGGRAPWIRLQNRKPTFFRLNK